jgi:magnesium transporter
MRRALKRKLIPNSPHKANPGSAPGVLTASPQSYPTQLLLMAYGPEGFIEHECKDPEEINKFLSVWPVVWINVVGLGNLDIIEKIGTMFDLDRLLLEDTLDTGHRPKVEFYDNYVFTIIRGGLFGDQYESEQLSLFLKKNVVIVFEEKPGTSFSQVRERIRRGTGKIRSSGTDYLYYALIDEVIDKYFPILDALNHKLAVLEDEVVASSTHNSHAIDMIRQIHMAKSDLLLLHRTVWPVGDIISMLMREETPLISKATRAFLRDCLDHAQQANELTQFYRDTASGLLNTFLAYEGHKTNEIVKVLTMVSAVFIPLTFIAGVYGMNFDPGTSPFNMPELDWYYGYPFALLLMLATTLFMLIYFKRRGWVPTTRPRGD